MKHLICNIKSDANGEVGLVVANEKVFSTGSVGFFGTTKITIDGEVYQSQCQFVKVGSKSPTLPTPDVASQFAAEPPVKKRKVQPSATRKPGKV